MPLHWHCNRHFITKYENKIFQLHGVTLLFYLLLITYITLTGVTIRVHHYKVLQ